MDKSDIDKLQRQALGAYLDAIERGSGVGRAKEGLAVVEGIVEAWLRERGLTEKSRRDVHPRQSIHVKTALSNHFYAYQTASIEGAELVRSQP